MSLARRLLGAGRRALPMLVVAVAVAVSGRTPLAVAIGGAAVAVAVGSLVAPSAMRRVDRAVGRLAGAAADGVFALLTTVCWAVAIVPAWAVGRVLRTSPLDAGRGSPGSAWIGIASTRQRLPDGTAPHPGRMGARGDDLPPTRRGRQAVRVAVVAVASLVAAVAIAGRGSPEPREVAAPVAADRAVLSWAGIPVTDYAHRDEPWIRDYFRELNRIPAQHDFVLGQRLVDVEGRYTTHRSGRRASYEPPAPRLTVWFFGGSTMYGVGQRDEHTIPSVVARTAEREGLPIRAVNFGVSGDVAWVEALRFGNALRTEADRPDLVVFYDGTNEMGVAQRRATSGSHDLGIIERLPLSEAEQELHDADLTPPARMGRGEYWDLVVALGGTQMARSIELAEMLAARAEVPIVRIWQPTFVAKLPSPADAELYDLLQFDPRGLPESREAYGRMRERAGADLVDLSRVLDGVDEELYFDHSHTNELGARLVGEALYRSIEPRLRELAAAG